MLGIKLFFDECCSKKLPGKIREVYQEDYPEIQTKHLTEFFLAGTDDLDWLSILEQDKEWIVITSDRGKDPKKPKLPLICPKIGITHISMTPALVADGYPAHKQALLSLWPEIMRIPLVPKGTRIGLGYRMVNKGLTQIPALYVGQDSFAFWCHQKQVPSVKIKKSN